MKLKQRIGFVVLALSVVLMACDDTVHKGNDGPAGDKNKKTGDVDAGEQDTGGGEAATLVTPIDRSGVYVLELTDGTDTLLFECVPAGGLVTKLQLNGVEILSQVEGTAGSTFWPSPQSEWNRNWPPPAALNTDDYTVTVDTETNTIVLTSPVDPDLNLQIVKRFSPDLVNMAINLNYTLINNGTEEQSRAPWEVTRVVPGGLTFYGTGSTVYDEGTMQKLPLQDAGGVTWFDHSDAEAFTGNNKSYADGSGGWLAHAQNGLVLVKTFADQSPEARAPGEAEIAIYVSGGTYQEVEEQGAYQAIPVGSSISFNVKWFLKAMPDGSTQMVGDQGLIDLASSLAAL